MARDLIRRDENNKKIIPESKLAGQNKAPEVFKTETDKLTAIIPKSIGLASSILNQIRIKRLELNIKQTEMANILEVEREQYSRLESGTSKMTVVQLIMVCNRLELYIVLKQNGCL